MPAPIAPDPLCASPAVQYNPPLYETKRKISGIYVRIVRIVRIHVLDCEISEIDEPVSTCPTAGHLASHELGRALDSIHSG